MNLTRQPVEGPDKNGFVGVSPEYANAASHTDLPLVATEDEVTDEEPVKVEDTEEDKGSGQHSALTTTSQPTPATPASSPPPPPPPGT